MKRGAKTLSKRKKNFSHPSKISEWGGKEKRRRGMNNQKKGERVIGRGGRGQNPMKKKGFIFP